MTAAESTESLAGISEFKDISEVAAAVFAVVKDRGAETKENLRKLTQPWFNLRGRSEADSKALFDQGFKILESQMNCITAADVGNKRGWALQEWAQKLEFPDILAIRQGVKGSGKPREVFEGWYTVRGKLIMQRPYLSANIDPEDSAGRVFDRGATGNLLLSWRFYWTMLEKAVKKGGAPIIGNGLYHIEPEDQELPAETLRIRTNPAPSAGFGRGGGGTTRIECLPAGTVVPFVISAPASHVSLESLAALLVIAGKHVGFSHGGSNNGYGTFTPKIESWHPVGDDLAEEVTELLRPVATG